jgi:hypothetical protein
MVAEGFAVSDAVGSAGVALLLAAFFANLYGFLDHRGRAYQSLNFIGAALACAASYMIGFFPFVVLEGAWALVAALALVRAPVASVH